MTAALRVTFAVLGVVLVWDMAAAENWPQWRGPRGDGHATEKGLPVEWSAESVAWTTPLKGEGHSSPVVWGERMFLTTALQRGRQRVVMCLDRSSGRILWERVAWTGTPEPTHKMNGWAAATCATDGERVYAFFGRGGGLFCYTADGELVWKKDLGEFEGPWGTAASPVLVGDLVIQNCDSDKDAFLIAFDKRTGQVVWKADRPDFRGWSTPILIRADARNVVRSLRDRTVGSRSDPTTLDELVLNGHTGVRAYDPLSGEELWRCQADRGRGEPTMTPGEDGLLFAIEGRKGGLIYAVRPGGSGDVTETHRAWHKVRSGGRDLPSPIAIGKHLLVMDMTGILTCFEGETGRQLWKSRIGGNFAASPVSWNGLAFFLNESGETLVIEPGEKLKIVARNRLDASEDEIFRAVITPSEGQLFIRSDGKLYCVGKRL